MKRMNSVTVLFAFLFSVCALTGWGLTPTVVMNTGDSMSLAGNRNETLTGPDGTTTFRNFAGKYIEVRGDSTITVSAAGDADRGLFCALIVTNGTLTLDLTALSDETPFRFDDGLVAKGAGRLLVKGRDHIDLGGLHSSDGRNFAAPADCPNISFAQADGSPYAEPTGLRLCHRFVEVALPTDVPWTIAPATTAVVFYATGAVLPTLKSGNRITLTDFDLWVNSSTVLTIDDTVVVPPGREFAIQPRSLELPSPNNECYYDFYGPGYTEWAFNVELGGEGAVFNFRNHHAMKHAGTISGVGSFRRTATAEQDNLSQLCGTYTFVGPVSLETARNPLEVVNQASLGADGNPLLLAAGAVVKFGTGPGVKSGALGPVSGPVSGTAASVTVGPQTTLEVGEVSGIVDFVGSGCASSTLVRTVLAAGELLAPSSSETLFRTVSPAVASSSDVITLVRGDGFNAYYRKVAADETVDLSSLGLPAETEYRLVARESESYSTVPTNVRLEIPSGVTASVSAEAGSAHRSAVYVDEGGMVRLVSCEPDWRAKVLCAFDPSQAATVTTEGTRAGGPLVKAVAPTIGTGYSLTYQSSTASTWPLYKSDGPLDPSFESLSYISCDPSDGNTRLSASPSIEAAFAILVFGSQKGGGQALFATPGTSTGGYSRGGIAGVWNETGSVVRPTKDAAILATNGIPVWVDGEAIDPLTTGFSGDWQVISLETTIASIAGLGYRSYTCVDASGKTVGNGAKYTSAGQNYGEMLFFAEAPTALERQAAERYLAKKWGVTYRGPSVEAVPFAVYGKGAVRLESNVDLGGSFAGTLDLNGYALTVADLPKPPDESAVPDGCLAWFDPSVEETLVLDGSKVRVEKMYRRDGTQATGEKYLNSASRPPMIKSVSRGSGPVRNWLFYSPYERYGSQVSKAGNGNSLRFNEVGQAEPATTEKPLTCQSIVMVQDSSLGGGTPFLDNRNGNKLFGPRFAVRSEDVVNPIPLASAPIWAGNSVATMADGAAYVDGLAVDGSRIGFNGRPEVFAATRAAGITIGYFADLYYQNSMTNLVPYGEIQGEILMFDHVLSATELTAVDAYLAWKWLGEARRGYTVSAGVTLTGEGSVVGMKADDRPTLPANFAGNVAWSSTNYAFSLSKDGTVAGKISQPNAALSFPASCTATVSVEKGIRAGVYELVAANEFTSSTVWNLVVATPCTRRLSLEVREGRLLLKVATRGFAITYR